MGSEGAEAVRGCWENKQGHLAAAKGSQGKIVKSLGRAFPSRSTPDGIQEAGEAELALILSACTLSYSVSLSSKDSVLAGWVPTVGLC